MKLNSLCIAVMLATSAYVNAAEIYSQEQSYQAGSQVSFNGDIYEAKWWANPGQSPADVAANPWDTPWELISEGDGVTPPPPVVDPEEPEVELPEGDYPQYKEGEKYKGGDVVQNENQLYRCKTGVTATWCSGAAWAYAPGTGTAWVDAWEKITEDDLIPPVDPEIPPVDPEVPPTGGDYKVNQSALDAKEAELTNFDVMNDVKASIATLDNESVERIIPGAESNPENVKRIEQIVSESTWNFLFPKRAPEYTYRHFLQATGKFPAFCGTYEDGRDSDAICKKSLATMFAHFTQETGGHTAHWEVPEWRQGLVHVREMGWTEEMRGGYNGECNPDVWQGQTWPCGTFDNGEFKSYFGRGAKQLSYNYNYGPFSDAMFGTVRTLLDNPEMVADTWLNLSSAVFFFVYPQPPKPSMLHVIDGTWQPNQADLNNGLVPGFGVTTQIINGGVECGGSVEVAQSLNRIKYYKEMANYLGVPIEDTEILGCKGMKQFDAAGAGAVNIYWEQDWGWSSETPDGKAYACQLVGYQTPHSAFKFRDYTKCVEANFPNIEVINDVD
ncbi:glycoside hydrolase family 19 protein [Aliivibrio fischeri]|uniref:glycoside hydrolase family 19 protein n=1 Tax=Aliivibrio fischeri TaxID=668 RepID=UPI0007C4A1FB|nr:glycoside hydrolase family 19 protein [Aliivibrio fischeri]